MPDIKQTIEDYVGLRAELDTLTEAMKEAKAKIDEVTAEIIGHMDMNSIATLESKDGYKISRSIRRSPDIDDAQALEDWAMSGGNEYIDGRWTLLQQQHSMKGVRQGIFIQQPNRRLCKVMLDHYALLAETTGRDINDLLPPGLQMKGTEFLTLRKPKRTKETVPVPASILLKMAKQGAAEKKEE